MFLVFIIVFCAIVALGFGAASAWSDISRLIIPNTYTLWIGAAFIPAFLAATIFAPDVSFFHSWKNHLLSAFFVFGITFVLFHFKVIGGGDSKLLSVYALWSGLSGLMPLLFAMSVFGGLLGIATLILNKNKLVKNPAKDSWIDKAQSGKKDVPYGAAIFAGALLSFWSSGYLKIGSLIELASTGVGS